jgi:hypothetical protein
LLMLGLLYLAGTSDILVPKNDIEVDEVFIPEFEPILEQTTDCKICHIKPEKVTKHIHGGDYCEPCHGNELHNIHIKDASTNISCVVCHFGESFLPEKLPDHTSVCDTCHGYPDPVQPSYGNIITIHATRGHACTICHIQDIQTLHEDSLKKSTSE